MHDTELDAEMRAAFDALEATIPEGYFDEFETKLQVRLEQEAMTETSNQIDTDTELGAASGETVTAPAHADSDLSDIRSLAAKTRESVSQRQVTIESSKEEPPISPISLALKTISLPEPDKAFKVFASGEGVKASAAVAAREDEGGLPTWIWAAVSAALAAAIVFFLVRGDQREDTTRIALSEPTPTAPDVPSQPSITDTIPDTSRPPDPTPDTLSPPGSADTLGGATNNDLAPKAAQADQVAETSTPTTRASGDRTPGTAKTSAGGNGTASRASAQMGTNAAAQDKKIEILDEKPADDKTVAPPKKKTDTLEDLLAEASATPKKADDKSSTVSAGASEDTKKPSRTSLDGTDVKKSMTAVEGKARACYAKYQQSGLVMIKFSVEPSGKVTSAAATGQFKGTDTGKCVADVVKTASFPAYDGPPSSFNYAFLLSQ